MTNRERLESDIVNLKLLGKHLFEDGEIKKLNEGHIRSLALSIQSLSILKEKLEQELYAP